MKTLSVDNIYLDKKRLLEWTQKLFSSKMKDSVWDNLSKTINNNEKLLYREWTIHKKDLENHLSSKKLAENILGHYLLHHV